MMRPKTTMNKEFIERPAAPEERGAWELVVRGIACSRAKKQQPSKQLISLAVRRHVGSRPAVVVKHNSAQSENARRRQEDAFSDARGSRRDRTCRAST